jgi:transposase
MGYKHKSKYAIKISLVVNNNGIPFSLDINKAHINDRKRLKSLLQNRLVKVRNRPLTKLIGDKRYDGEKLKKIGRIFFCRMITPSKKNAKKPNTETEKRSLKKRPIIERTFARLYQFARINKALDSQLYIYLAWCTFACAIIEVGNIEQS